MRKIYKNFLLLLAIITLSQAQFSSFVKDFMLDTPKQFITPVNLTRPIREHLSIMSTDGVTFDIDKRLNNIKDLQDMFKSDTSFNQPFKSTKCNPPFVLVRGFCACPPNQKRLLNKCIPQKNPNINQQANPITQDPDQNKNFGTGQCPLLKINKNLKRGTIELLATIQRSYDGTNNNRQNPNWGSAGSFLQRRAPANYANGIDVPVKNLISPRAISNIIGSQKQPVEKSRVNATVIFTIFGQFVDHDLDLTFAQRTPPANQFMDIQIPPSDPFFRNQQTIKFARSDFTLVNNEPRKFKNMITSWIDGSQIYGSDNTTNCALRQFKNGRLKISGKQGQQLLPLFNGFFRAGDVRAIQNSILASIHTIFLREHNRVCAQILRNSPKLNDQTVFQIARNFVIGLLQKIYMYDFVPILIGERNFDRIVGDYLGYRSNINPTIPTQFSTASFRVGHSLLMGTIPAVDQRGKIVKNFRLNQLFFRQQEVNHQFVSNILRGASRTATKNKNGQLIDDIRNLLVLDPSRRQVKLDLFSLNVQRGRDHGLPTYNQARVAFGLRKISTFQQLVQTSELEIAQKLKSIYATPDVMQLFVGIICQKPLSGAIVGELGARIIGQTFRNLRDADRFWYQKAFPDIIIEEINNTDLGDIIQRNTNAKDLQNDVFKL